ncbi:MAG: response regulator [Desulfovermiculus sp.]
MNEISHQPLFHIRTEEQRLQTPRAKQKNRTKPKYEQHGHSFGPKQTTSGRGLHVLVVEDNEMVNTLIKAMLELLGHEAICAKDGFEAAELFHNQQNDIGLVLLDVVMPGQSGWDVLSALRKTGSQIPVIMISGYYENPAHPKKITLQPQAFLHKPFTMKALEEAIQTALTTNTVNDRKAMAHYHRL